jgi:hypothetical protein
MGLNPNKLAVRASHGHPLPEFKPEGAIERK